MELLRGGKALQRNLPRLHPRAEDEASEMRFKKACPACWGSGCGLLCHTRVLLHEAEETKASD